MVTNTEGIIFRQTKATNGRKMLLLFTKKYGKISVGTNLGDKGKTKSSLAFRPFTYGNYQIYQGRNYYNLDRAETIKSFYGIGEDLDKYFAASYVLELTEKVVQEDVSQPQIFDLLIHFLAELTERKNHHLTLILAYEIKLLRILGTFPHLKSCVHCGKDVSLPFFSVPEGGMICESCEQKITQGLDNSLIFSVNFDIINIINYFAKNPFTTFRKLALEETTAKNLQTLMRSYFSYHLDVDKLKSEVTFIDAL